MKHLVICDYGAFLGLHSHRLAVRQDDETRYYPLNRLCTVTIAKRGVSVSSDLVEAFSQRGIKLFFLDFRGIAHSAILGQSQHGVDLKKALITEVQNTCAKRYLYRKKKHKLEHIIQRQVYRLCGHFYNEKTYKPYLFKW